MAIFRNSALACTGAALLSSAVAPVIAAPITRNLQAYSVQAETIAGDNTHDYRRHRRHHDDRIDGGDVAAGLGILAGIVIIASIANEAKKSSRKTSGDRYPEPFPEPSRDNAPDASYKGGDDVGSAVTQCSEAAERTAGNGARVDEIRSVTRAGSGWQVEGDMAGGSRGFSCATANGGIEYVRMNDGAAI